MDLSGKRAIVTGAGGDGLGQPIAHRLGGCGADAAVPGFLEDVLRGAACGTSARQPRPRPIWRSAGVKKAQWAAHTGR